MSHFDFRLNRNGGGGGVSQVQVDAAVAAALAGISTSLFTRETDTSTAVTAGEGLLVNSTGVTVTFPATGADGQEILVGNRSGGPVDLVGSLDGDADGQIVTNGVVVFRWSAADGFWRGVIFSFGLSTGGSAITSIPLQEVT